MSWCRSSVSGVQDSHPPAVMLEYKRDSIHSTHALQSPQPGQDPALYFPSSALS